MTLLNGATTPEEGDGKYNCTQSCQKDRGAQEAMAEIGHLFKTSQNKSGWLEQKGELFKFEKKDTTYVETTLKSRDSVSRWTAPPDQSGARGGQ